MPMTISNTYQQKLFFSLFIFALALSVGSFVLQFGFHLEPCSLCMIARALVMMITAIFGIALIHQPQAFGAHVYRFIGGLLAILGIAVTARHLWILNLPPEALPDCIPSFDYLLKILPLKDALTLSLKGSNECSQQNPSFLGLSLPLWTLGGFAIIALSSLLPWRCLCKYKKCIEA